MSKTSQLILLCAFLCVYSNARASLGDQVGLTQSTSSARIKTQSVQSSSGTLFSVRTNVTTGLTVKEFVSSDGVVFAMSWVGISQPSIASILGRYSEEYKNANKDQLRTIRRRGLDLRTSKVVVHRAGHMNDLRGFAYVPTLMPSGVNLGDLK